MKESKQILTALRLLETRFGGALTGQNITRFMVISFVLLIASLVSAQEKIPSGKVEIDERSFSDNLLIEFGVTIGGLY